MGDEFLRPWLIYRFPASDNLLTSESVADTMNYLSGFDSDVHMSLYVCGV